MCRETSHATSGSGRVPAPSAEAGDPFGDTRTDSSLAAAPRRRSQLAYPVRVTNTLPTMSPAHGLEMLGGQGMGSVVESSGAFAEYTPPGYILKGYRGGERSCGAAGPAFPHRHGHTGESPAGKLGTELRRAML